MSGKQQPTVDTTDAAETNQSPNTSTDTPMTPEGTMTTRLADLATGDSIDVTDESQSIRSQLDSKEDQDETDAAPGESTNLIPEECDECGSDNLQQSDKHREIACTDCGNIVRDHAFPEEADWKRESAAIHETETDVTSNDNAGISLNALGGTIDWKDMDGYGDSLSSKKRSRMHRLRSLDRQSSTQDPEESNYKYGLGEINRIAADIEVPRFVRDAAAEMYDEAIQADALTGRSVEAVATAVLYAACIEKGTPREMAELTAVSRAEHLEVFDTYDAVAKELGAHDYDTPVTAYVPVLADALDLRPDADARDIATTILEGAVTETALGESALIEHTAAAMYTACVRAGNPISQGAIARASGIDESSLRTRYQQHLEAISLN